MELEILKPRHSLAHLLAQAIQQTIDPSVALGTGPAVDDGFYYDVLFSDDITFGEENMKELTKVIQGLVKQNQKFVFYKAESKEQAEKIIWFFGEAGRFKKELINKFSEKGINEYTFYMNTIPAAAAEKLLNYTSPEYREIYKKISGFFYADNDQFVTFIDLCEGPHVENTKEIDPNSFVLDKIAGAYRQAKEDNPQMTRIYGLAFESKDALKAHQTMMEEAKKRDHRVLGQQLQLFTFDDEVGPGLPLWLPNGAIIVEEIERLAKEKENEYGYQRVRSPHIAKDKLYMRSGHLPYYEESMFPPMEMDGEKYYLKAMNCPHHHKIFGAVPKSYRDLPARYAEYGHCYRYEDSGALFGLMRVRSLCMNDAHIYCTEEQFEEEFVKVIDMYLFYFKLFGIDKYQMRLSKHSKEGLGKKYVDNEKLWIKTEDQVRNALVKCGVPFVEEEDEAAFYGPKIDVQIWSIIGREFTLATNQLDFAVPDRFNLTYTDKDGTDKTPICIHRAPLSTHERFIGFLIEHFAGAFPLWMTPTQIVFIPVADNDKFVIKCRQLQIDCAKNQLRAKVDESSDSFSKKIRNAEIAKIPYIVVIGEEEINNNSVAVRVYKTKDQSSMNSGEFIAKVVKEYHDRSM